MTALLLALLLSPLPLGEGRGEGAVPHASLPSAGDLEAQATAHTRTAYTRAQLPAPQPDAALAAAARRLAAQALRGDTSGPLEHAALTEALSAAGAADPAPRILTIRAWARAHAVEELRAFRGLASAPVTHVGAGAAVEGSRAVLVVLLAERLATLAPFARTLEAPGRHALCGELAERLSGARVYVTHPDGQVEQLAARHTRSTSFCATLTLPTPGRYTVEVVAARGRGPEVTSLFLVDVGPPAAHGPGASSHGPPPSTEPTTEEEARRVLLERIHTLRRAHGRQPLTPDPVLARVAQAYSERMAREGFFAHVAPDGEDTRARLVAARYGARLAGENIARASGPLAAHVSLERSPGHRANLLGPAFTHVGIGVAFREEGGRREVLVTQVLATPGLAAPSGP